MKKADEITLLIQLLQNASLVVSVQKTTECAIALTLHCRNNPDGTVRWLWPAGAREAGCLQFYNTGSPKARLFSTIFSGIFAAGFENLLSQHTYTFYISRQSVILINKEWGRNFAIFTGTPGPNRKGVIWYEKDDQHYFIKVALSERSKAIIMYERQVLQELRQKTEKYFDIPVVADGRSASVTLTGVKNSKSERVAVFSSIHQATLKEWYKDASLGKISQLSQYEQTRNWLKELAVSNDKRIPKGIIKKLEYLFSSIDKSQEVVFSHAHGDFTPWNMYVDHDRLQVYDWELFIEKAPLFWDAFHFIFQSGILVHRYTASEIMDKCYHLQEIWWLPNIPGSYVNRQQNLELYLLMNCVYYLHIYSIQSKWHMQVEWLLNTWSDALSILLANKNLLSQRQLLCIDLFNRLQPLSYAALKWMDGKPETIPLRSDIDLLLEKTSLTAIARFIKHHPFTADIHITRKSFMTTFTVFTREGSLLSIDGITRIKRRDIHMLEEQMVLSHTRLLASGVKVPSIEMDFAYTWLFYMLNGAAVPEKYKQYFMLIPEYERINLNNWFVSHWSCTGVSHYSQALGEDRGVMNAVSKQINAQPENNGFARLRNSLAYYWDSYKSFWSKKGLIITFSGVDGAGKSTVIENTKRELEKRFRKKVVVLRHRPSVLPILSAWKHGKEEAERISVSKLPRQGVNKNRLSSLIRFGYYFLDYLLGQFYIQFKYVSRGYIVLYDRYYFDFINDSQRSNIQLPGRFTSWFYRFLVKPRLNFFLYANPEAILKRKQELNASTIQELTGKYLQLFNRLAQRYRASKYISIYNEKLDETITTIVDHIKMAAR